ncbi:MULTISPECIES: hypothetical protein [Aerosakkonema]|uniref:hypothetical protein n=1 Tax=Aerosakkonema TaxID=1246629 RepID=UPI0035BB37E3
MNDKPSIPDPETSKRLLADIRRRSLAIEAATLQLEEVTARLEHDTREQRLKRLKNSLKTQSN